MVDVQVRDVPELTVATEVRTVDQEALGRWLPDAMARVAAAAKAAGGVAGTHALPFVGRSGLPDQPVFLVLYEGNPNEGPCEVEVCAPLCPGAAVPDGIAWRRIPAGREAYVRVTKETVTSGGLSAVYEAIGEWIFANGMVIAAAPRETYWTDFFGAAPGDDVFDVAFPCREA
jgi:hypothetical protein